MSLSTFSVFYFDFEFSDDFKAIDFDEGGPLLVAEVEQGAFTPTEMASKIAEAMNEVGALTYICTFNRLTRSFTIQSTGGNFALRVATGTSGNKAFSIFGFLGSDRTGASSYTGIEAGKEYVPQFVLQDHIATDNFQSLIDPSINRSSSGKVEVIRFGVEKFMQCNIKYVTNLQMDGKVIRNNPNGLQDLQDFMQYLILKKPVEFMKNLGDRNDFQKFILESTPSERDGSGYRLRELYDQDLPNFYESGQLVFRLIEG